MRILLASDTFPPQVNGAAYFTRRFAYALVEDGHSVAVLAPSTGRRSRVERDGPVTVYRLPAFPVPLYSQMDASLPWIVRRRMRAFVRHFGPDVIHIQNHFLVGRGAVRVARQLKIPVVGTNHFMPENILPHAPVPPPLKPSTARWMWRDFARVYRKLDAIAAPTRTAAAMAEEWVGKPIAAISCGLDLRKFSPRKSGAYLRSRYRLPQRQIILSVGRLEEEKRNETTIAAMPEILRNVDAQLVIAGTGDLRVQLEQQAAGLGISERVSFLGFVPDADLPNLYPLADVFVTGGIAELQSIVTMEAMASGLPVIASEAGALPELVGDAENGYLFSDGDADTLAQRAVHLLTDDDLRIQMGRKSLQKIQQHDIQATVRSYIHMYQAGITTAASRRAVPRRPLPQAQRWGIIAPIVGVGPIALVALLMLIASGVQSTVFARTVENKYVAVKEKVAQYADQHELTSLKAFDGQ